MIHQIAPLPEVLRQELVRAQFLSKWQNFTPICSYEHMLCCIDFFADFDVDNGGLGGGEKGFFSCIIG